MLLLALDTSTRQASLAICTEDELLGEYTWHVGNNHSVELLDRIRRIVVECNKTMQEIDVVAVATGPGSFNGVGGAESAAQAPGFSFEKPIPGGRTVVIITGYQQHLHCPER